MATTHSSTTLVVAVMMMLLMSMCVSARKHVVLRYYTQQQLGVNEFGSVPAVIPPVNGTFTGVGLEVVYNYTVTRTGEPTSQVLGTIRGTSVVVSTRPKPHSSLSTPWSITRTPRKEASMAPSPHKGRRTSGPGLSS